MSLTNQPLTDEQKVTVSGVIFPSGEANYYDFSQSHEYHDGSGINYTFPDPHESGIIKTYGPEGSPSEGSGVFSRVGNSSSFSNADTINTSLITDFTSFNNYIHFYLDQDGNQITIPYTSEYDIGFTYYRYFTD